MSVKTIGYLSPEEAVFTGTDEHFLFLKLPDKDTYPRVDLFRMFPFSHKNRMISVKEPGGAEIGIIRDMDDFPEIVRAILEKELDRRYFTPVVTGINRIREEYGQIYWEVETDRGRSSFTIRSSDRSVQQLPDGSCIITDPEGNRYDQGYRIYDCETAECSGRSS